MSISTGPIVVPKAKKTVLHCWNKEKERRGEGKEKKEKEKKRVNLYKEF